jgi:hypothetical protein
MVSEVQIRNKDGSLAQTTTDNVNAAIGGTDAPAAGDTGASTTNGFLRWLRDKLYSISPSNWLVVGGAAAVGSSPTVPPVGVSGIDGSGLKRSLLTDSIGQLMTSEQDSAVFTASVSAASVLFTVDMTNWRSVLLQITSAGSSCTVIYECSNDQVTWIPVVGQLVSANSATTPSSSLAPTTSTTATQYHFPKRGKYFRARVSIYGSGTVSVSYSLSCAEVHPMIAAAIYGQVQEGSAFSGNPVTISVECRTTRKTAVANGQIVRPIGTVDGRLIVRNHSIPENEWKYAAASGGIVNTTTGVNLALAGGTGVSVYITSMQIRAQALGNATEIVLLDGTAAVYWRSEIGTAGLPLTEIVFEDPIKLLSNSTLTFATVTASGTGAVYVNAQGYYAP